MCNKFNRYKLSAGIDFGTTNSLISVFYKNHEIKVLSDSYGNQLLPSVVYYGLNNQILVGEEAKKKLQIDPQNTIYSIKRILGLSYQEIRDIFPYLSFNFYSNEKNLVFIKTNHGKISLIQVISEILKTLVKRIDYYNFNKKLRGVVITVPAHFNEIQRRKLREAAYLSNLNVFRLLNEPTAAAIAYGFHKDSNKRIIAVYDLGGGTFDISILKIEDGVFKVLSTSGDNILGGDDFDQLIVNWIYKKMKLSVNTIDENLKNKILNAAIQSKIELSYSSYSKFRINNFEIVLSRKKLNELISPLIKKTILITYKAIKDANIKKEEVSELIMVGGSTYIPLILDLVSNFFSLVPLCSIDPEKVVSIGASIYANILAGNVFNNSFLLLDVTSLSFGLEVIGNRVEKIISKNTILPTKKEQLFTTFKNNQTSMRFHVVQGESEILSECFSLGEFILNKIPPLPAGEVHILVTFEIDVNGILTVSAFEKISGESSFIKINILHKFYN